LTYLFTTLLTSLIGILIGLLAIWFLLAPLHSFGSQLRGRLLAAWQKLRLLIEQAAGPPASTTGEETAAAPRTSDESLSARLHRLDSVFAASTSNASHPRELAEQREFLEAVELLKAPTVPLDTVMQYVQGANWGLASAALAALNQRPDGGQVVDEVLAHFDNLYPWPMHFALEYFVSAEPRPPVGTPLAGAKDWWCDNAVIPVLFRDYFAQRERLGDVPVFGPTAPPPQASATIKLLLERIRHPYAAALIDDLQSLQRTNIDRAFLTSFGRFWSDGKGLDILLEPEVWRDGLVAAEAASLEAPGRSLLASGDHRVGKTSFLKLLSKRLAGEGWTVFEASGADLMAGQQ